MEFIPLSLINQQCRYITAEDNNFVKFNNATSFGLLGHLQAWMNVI